VQVRRVGEGGRDLLPPRSGERCHALRAARDERAQRVCRLVVTAPGGRSSASRPRT
jgi:hypothetical protein